MPFEPTVIEIDTLALGNPLWVPASALVTASPAPNTFRFVTLPILIGGDVNGQVVLEGCARGLSGIPNQLHHLGTGAVRTIRTFTDGAFYGACLRPGTYDVTIPDDILARPCARMRPVVFTIASGEGESRADVTVTLEPDTDPAPWRVAARRPTH